MGRLEMVYSIVRSNNLLKFFYIPYILQISALIGGVVTKIRSNLNTAGFLHQACKIGILVHFESLLSTYGELDHSLN